MGHMGNMAELDAAYRQMIVDGLRATGMPFDPDNIYGMYDGAVDAHLGFRRSRCDVAPADEKDIILVERTESVFGDTFSGNTDEVVIAGEGFRCACGQCEGFALFISTDFDNIMGFLTRRVAVLGDAAEAVSKMQDIAPEMRRKTVLDDVIQHGRYE